MAEDIISDQEIEHIIQEMEAGQEKTDDSMFSPFAVDFQRLSNNDRSWEGFAATFKSLPASIQDILVSSETRSFLRSLAESSQLSSEQSAELSRIVRNVLMGVMFVGDMVNELVTRLHIDQSRAQEIRSQITEELFAPAIEDLKNIQQTKFPDKLKGQSTASAPSGGAVPTNTLDLRQQK